MRPNQIKYRFRDHKREGSRSSHRRRKKKKNTNKIGTARKERKKDTVRHDKETDRYLEQTRQVITIILFVVKIKHNKEGWLE